MSERTDVHGYAFADTPDGRVIVVTSPSGVAYVGWGANDAMLIAGAAARLPDADLELGAHKAEKLAEKVARVASNPKRAKADSIPLDAAGTEFQREVWAVLRAIPAGSTMSYAEVAKAVGRPGAARAVGAACGANPTPIVVPCHRVVASDGSIGGFSGEPWRKVAMLDREGAR